jgi:DNA-binding NarL/FixJ family response regulator
VSKIRVLLVDDHETVRQGLRLLLDTQPDIEVVGEAGSGTSALERAQALRPNVVVMDVTMPEMNGLEATRSLRARGIETAVVALTRHEDEAYVQEMLGAGASGYVLKQSPSTELLRAGRTAAAGQRYLDANVAANVAGAYLRKYGKRDQPGPTISDREAEVLRQMAWGWSNKEIAAQLNVSVKTVEVHKANAMRKLGLHGRIDIVRYALLQGWLKDS